jgi:hypothetical protein
VKVKVRLFILGFVVGACAALPLGINFGRDAPLLSNPFVGSDVQHQLVERMKSGTRTALKDARERLHDATESVAPPQ